MFVELPQFNPDRTSIERRKVFVNTDLIAGIQKMKVQSPGPNDIPIVLGEAWQIMLSGGGQVLVELTADIMGMLVRAGETPMKPGRKPPILQ